MAAEGDQGGGARGCHERGPTAARCEDQASRRSPAAAPLCRWARALPAILGSAAGRAKGSGGAKEGGSRGGMGRERVILGERGGDGEGERM